MKARPTQLIWRSLLLLIPLIFAACTAAGIGDTQVAPPATGAARLTDLASLDPLRERFNADAGKERLLLIMAPT
jgi:hypothetical protein